MAKRFPFQPLHELASDRLEAATRQLAELKRRWQVEEDKLAQLHGFRDEYRKRLGDAIATGMDMSRMRDFHGFLAKIETAIRQQSVEITHCKMAWEEGQRHWLEERRKLQTYDVLKDRHVRAERFREGRIEQREQDEHARKSAGAQAHESGPRRKA